MPFIHLREGAALARLHAPGIDRDESFAVVQQHVARLIFIAIDFMSILTGLEPKSGLDGVGSAGAAGFGRGSAGCRRRIGHQPESGAPTFHRHSPESTAHLELSGPPADFYYGAIGMFQKLLDRLGLMPLIPPTRAFAAGILDAVRPMTDGRCRVFDDKPSNPTEAAVKAAVNLYQAEGERCHCAGWRVGHGTGQVRCPTGRFRSTAVAV